MSIAASRTGATPAGLRFGLRSIPGRGVGDTLQRAAWSHPEWWTLVLAALAWAALLGLNTLQPGASGSEGHHHLAADGAAGIAIVFSIGHWLLMVVAMMFPLITPSVRVTAFRSFRRRRHRAVAGFLLGYLAIWAGLGAAVSGLMAGLPQLSQGWQGEAAAVAFVVAAAWQWTRAKERSLVACHKTMPLAARGPRADRDCLAFGWHIGLSCCAACWPLMLACTLAGHSTLALVACGALGWIERKGWRPRTRLASIGALALAIVFGGIL